MLTHRFPAPRSPRGLSLVGILVSLVIVAVLFSISMTALNKAVTGEGSAREGTVRSFKDQFALQQLFQVLAVTEADFGGRYLTPSAVMENAGGPADPGFDTTASLYSALVMNNYVTPELLIAANEYNGWIVVDEDYDYQAYDPANGIAWDPTFEGDLERGSNVSFAHMPLYGERLRKRWKGAFGPNFVILGTRGPENGIDDPDSYTYGRSGVWGGHVVYGDGAIDFIDTFTPPRLVWMQNDVRVPDNLFAMEGGANGEDSILAFTTAMDEREGPTLQWD